MLQICLLAVSMRGVWTQCFIYHGAMLPKAHRKHHTFSFFNGFDFGVGFGERLSYRTYLRGSTIHRFCSSASSSFVPQISRDVNLVLKTDLHPTSKCHPVSINWLFLQRDLKRLLTGFQIEHTDTESSLLAKTGAEIQDVKISNENV